MILPESHRQTAPVRSVTDRTGTRPLAAEASGDRRFAPNDANVRINGKLEILTALDTGAATVVCAATEKVAAIYACQRFTVCTVSTLAIGNQTTKVPTS